LIGAIWRTALRLISSRSTVKEAVSTTRSPAYRQLLGLAVAHGIEDVARTAPGPGAHAGRLGLLALFIQAEAGTMRRSP